VRENYLAGGMGLSNDEIAARLDASRQLVSRWYKRFVIGRVHGLEEQPRTGRPARFPPLRRQWFITVLFVEILVLGQRYAEGSKTRYPSAPLIGAGLGAQERESLYPACAAMVKRDD
jgi:hypothetical protein